MSFTLPYVYWNSPPEMNYTCALISKNKDRLILGTKSGNCVLYSIKKSKNNSMLGGDKKQTQEQSLQTFSTNLVSGATSIDPQQQQQQQQQNNLEVNKPLLTLKEKESISVLPLSILIRHGAEVTSMVEINFDYKPSCCSISKDGTICVWSLVDGFCFHINPYFITGSPTSMCVMKDNNRLAIVGKRNYIDIVELPTMKLVQKYEGHTEWVSSVSFGKFQTEDILLSLSDDHTFRYWVTDSSHENNNIQTSTSGKDPNHLQKGVGKLPIYIVQHPLDKPLCIQENSDWSYMFIMNREKVLLYTYRHIKPTYTLLAPQGKFLKGGFFIGTFCIFVYTEDGHGYLYRLKGYDLKKMQQKNHKEGSIDSRDNNYEIIDMAEAHGNMLTTSRDYSIELPPSKNSKKNLFIQLPSSHLTMPKDDSVAEQTQKSPLSRAAIFFGSIFKTPTANHNTSSKMFTGIEKNQADIAAVGAEGNTLTLSDQLSPPSAGVTPSLSHVGSKAEFMLEENDEEKIEIPEIDKKAPKLIKDFIHVVDNSVDKESSFKSQDSIWSCQGTYLVRADLSGNVKMWHISVKESDVEVTDMITISLEAGWPKSDFKSKITSSQYIVDKKKPPKLIYGFEDGSISVMPCIASDEKLLVFQAHSQAVTSLLVMYDVTKQHRLLITGSQDYAVKVWDLDNAILLKEFLFHSGSVLTVFRPPREVETVVPNCFCSVGDDRSVIMYSLEGLKMLYIFGGHSSNVIGLYWRTSLDNLLVRCSDGTLYVWHISLGVLDRRIRGKIAAEIIERSEGPGWRKHTSKLSLSKMSVYSHSKGMLDTQQLVVNNNEPKVELLLLSLRYLIAYFLEPANQEEITESLRDIKGKPLPYAVTTTLSYLFEFEDNPHLKRLREKLGIHKPNPAAYIGINGPGQSISLLVPKAAEHFHVFSFSAILSTLYTIGCVAVLKVLYMVPDLSVLCTNCMKFYLIDLPKEVEEYEEPSYLFASQFLKDPSKDIQDAAKAVMTTVYDRMSPTKVQELCQQFCNMILECHSVETAARKDKIVIALASLLARGSKVVDKKTLTIAAMGLVEILVHGGPQHITAISLLGEAYSLWKYYIPEPMELMNQLFKLSLPIFSIEKRNKVTEFLATDAHTAFLSMANSDPKLYVDFITSVITNLSNVPSVICSAIVSIYSLIQKYPTSLMEHLQAITALVVRALDPHSILKETCFSSAINVLRLVVDTYPMVSFHQESQKYALGIPEGLIIIYDLRTASKSQIFEAHKGPIYALAFSPNGDKLASYCSTEEAVCVWNVDNSNVLSLLGVSSRLAESFKIASRVKLSPLEILKHVKLVWGSNKYVTIKTSQDVTPTTFQLSD